MPNYVYWASTLLLIGINNHMYITAAATIAGPNAAATVTTDDVTVTATATAQDGRCRALRA